MPRRAALRFWLLAMDITLWLGWRRGWDFSLVRACNLTDWGPE